MGSIYQRGDTFWIQYYRNGRKLRESSGSDKETEARRLLRLREGDIERGLPVSPRMGRLRFEDAMADVLTDYRVNGKKSLDHIQRRLDKHLVPFFGGRRMANITTADVRKYTEARQQEGAANASINRELAILKRMFTLAIQAGKLMARPHIPMLREDNVRTGFFEREQYEAVKAKLPGPLQPVVTFAYITGWRIMSEVLPLQWRQVDLDGGTVRLDAGTTKNREGRVFPLTVELKQLLEAQKALTEAYQREAEKICPWVFHRSGKRIKSFRGAWDTVTAAAGCPGRIPHDLRRTAVRNLVRAGVPERVAMTLTGHKTRSVFERYNIVSVGDLVDAAGRLDRLGVAGT